LVISISKTLPLEKLFHSFFFLSRKESIEAWAYNRLVVNKDNQFGFNLRYHIREFLLFNQIIVQFDELLLKLDNERVHQKI
jgi:hypothetical protein